jgi:hypothetical protein
MKWLLLPAFVHVAMVLFIGTRMGRARFRAARSGAVKVRDIAADSSRWPDEVRKISNSYQNQFELPVLFYALLPLLIATAMVDRVMIALAWAFIASRVVHAAIHIGPNIVIRRFQAFLFGFLAVVAMWTWFGFRLYFIG